MNTGRRIVSTSTRIRSHFPRVRLQIQVDVRRTIRPSVADRSPYDTGRQIIKNVDVDVAVDGVYEEVTWS